MSFMMKHVMIITYRLHIRYMYTYVYVNAKITCQF